MMELKQQQTLHESFRPCRDVLFTMIPLLALSCALYGLRPLTLMTTALLTAMLCDLAAALLRKAVFVASDISSLMFAAVFTIMLPASCPYGVVIIGTAVTVLLGKHAFGGYGAYPFHPSAFGFAFASICWPDIIFSYPTSSSTIGIGFSVNVQGQSGIASILKAGGTPKIELTDLILGDYPGPMGTTFCLVLIACLVFFIARRTLSWRIPMTFLATCAVWAFLFPRTAAGRGASVLYELFSGAIIFAAVFIAAEPTTAPSGKTARLVYGLLLGTGTMAFRTWGSYEMGVCFAILLLNTLSSYLDRVLTKSAVRAGGKGVDGL